MAFTGYKTLQIAGEGTLTIEATTIAGNLTVQLTGPDGEVLWTKRPIPTPSGSWTPPTPCS